MNISKIEFDYFLLLDGYFKCVNVDLKYIQQLALLTNYMSHILTDLFNRFRPLNQINKIKYEQVFMLKMFRTGYNV